MEAETHAGSGPSELSLTLQREIGPYGSRDYLAGLDRRGCRYLQSEFGHLDRRRMTLGKASLSARWRA